MNAVVTDFKPPSIGDVVSIDCSRASLWKPAVPSRPQEIPQIEIPQAIEREAREFLSWLRNEGSPPDALIGLGPGLTPAGDDFVGGAMIALRVRGDTRLADRIAGWALPLADANTSRISRAHLECAAQGEGHEYLHAFLSAPTRDNLDRLSRVGHTSGLDAAAGAASAIPCAR